MLFLACQLLLFVCCAQAELNLTIGTVHGEAVSDGRVVRYLGIPYAKPPLGNLRYAPPEAADNLTEALNATTLPNSCWQIPFVTFKDTKSAAGENAWNPNTPMSEDCLYLNIWMPATPDANRTVLLWIYGGGFVSGTATLDLYDGAALANETSAIVVSMNYRVASFGFLTAGVTDAPGNVGLMDQALAIKFVNDNLEALGGGHIRLFGESAGSASVGLHLILNTSKFDSALMQSASPTADWAVKPLSEGLRRTRAFATAVGCSMTDWNAVIGCLRAKPAGDLANSDWLSAGPFQFTWTPVIDGSYLKQDIQTSLSQGAFKKVPLTVGSNLQEGNYFLAYEYPHWVTQTGASIIAQFNSTTYKTHMKHIFRFYPGWNEAASDIFLESLAAVYEPESKTSADYFKALDLATGDFHVTCGVNAFAEAFAKQGVATSYFRFGYISAESHWPQYWGALHGDEIRFLFGVPLREGANFSTQPEEATLSRAMIRDVLMMPSNLPSLNATFKTVQVYNAENLEGKAQMDLVRGPYCDWWRQSAGQLQAAGLKLQAMAANRTNTTTVISTGGCSSGYSLLEKALIGGIAGAAAVIALLFMTVIIMSSKLSRSSGYKL